MNDKYKLIIDKLTKQDLVKIYIDLNNWKWNTKLGDIPEGWEDIPNYMASNYCTLPTKEKIVMPIMGHILTKVKYKEIERFYTMTYYEWTGLQYTVWHIKDVICKFLGVGIYSKKNMGKLINKLRQEEKNYTDEWNRKSYCAGKSEE